MNGRNVAWSRLETRAAILDYLWRTHGSFRPELIGYVSLTDASVSRILNELRAEGLVTETRRRAPYRGGPSVFVGLSAAQQVGAIELSNGAIHTGVGTLTGEVLSSGTRPLPDGASPAETQDAIADAIECLATWSRGGTQPLRQVAISVPGYHPERTANPIVPFDRRGTLARLEAALPSVPVTIADSIVARTLTHRLGAMPKTPEEPYLHVFIGHGVGAAFVDEQAEGDGLTIYELGHNVVARHGPPCRCGHHGCVEAFVSTTALASLLGIPEPDVLAGHMPAATALAPAILAEIELRLADLGMVLGNALNLRRVRRIVIAGWPEWLGQRAKLALMAGLDRSLFAGAQDVSLAFSPMPLGQEPASGLALACFAFIRRGGQRDAPEASGTQTDYAAAER